MCFPLERGAYFSKNMHRTRAGSTKWPLGEGLGELLGPLGRFLAPLEATSKQHLKKDSFSNAT